MLITSMIDVIFIMLAFFVCVTELKKGRLMVESRPARTWGPEDPESDEYYRQPFLTTITLWLPETI
jgi:biopolymer transport protein ExbD